MLESAAQVAAPIAALSSILRAGKKKAPKGQTFAGGTANYYDDSMLPILQKLMAGGVSEGGGAAGSLTDLLAAYKGNAKDLHDWVGRMSPFIASSLAGTPAFKSLQNFTENSDLVSSYGSVAGANARGATDARRTGERQLAETGLGRSAARSSLASSTALSGDTASSDAFSRLYQGQMQMRQQFAQTAFDAHRMVGQIALGSNPTPSSNNGSSNPWIPLAGAGIGAAGNILAALV